MYNFFKGHIIPQKLKEYCIEKEPYKPSLAMRDKYAYNPTTHRLQVKIVGSQI